MSEKSRWRLLRSRYWLAIACASTAFVGAVLAFEQLERRLIAGGGFLLEGPPQPGEMSDAFEIEGVVHASRDSVARVFARDFGRSVYLVPLEERRRNLLAVNWVADASVGRLWPNRLRVRIRERQPVAFVQLAREDAGRSEELSHFALVDADGIILYPQAPARFHLPVLTGLSPAHSEPERRRRMRSVLRLLEDLRELADEISEIDVSEPDNLRVTQQVDDHAVVLILGNTRFRQRIRSFLANYPEIRDRLPEATTLDLRIDDRITAVAGDAVAGRKGGRHGH